MVISKTYKDLKPYLMDSSGKGLENPYYKIVENGQVIYVVSPGLNSEEYNKTAIFNNNTAGAALFQVLYGQGLMLMQRGDEFGETKEFKVISLSGGTQVNMPVGWLGCLVNVGKGFLVVLSAGDIESEVQESEEIIKRKGLAYYVIEKKGEISFKQNPNYKVHPQISTE